MLIPTETIIKIFIAQNTIVEGLVGINKTRLEEQNQIGSRVNCAFFPHFKMIARYTYDVTRIFFCFVRPIQSANSTVFGTWQNN